MFLPILAAKTVDVASLLREMADLRELAQRPDPIYRYRQWTSYDRSPVPFANGDAGNFLRDEGRERVMADVRGPGALVRLWSANPSGTLRFYFDGEAKPRLVENMATMLTGKDARFPDPFAYVAARGANLYFPLPFAKGLKVTWEGGPKAGLYYAVGIREYAPGMAVTTFTTAAVGAARPEMAAAAKALFPTAAIPWAFGTTISPGSSIDYGFGSKTGSEIDGMRIAIDAKEDPTKPWNDPAQRHNILRRLRLRIVFDGEKTVDAPLGDFFGVTAGGVYESLPVSVEKDGTMVCRWLMPFLRRAVMTISNGNSTPVSIRIGTRRRTAPFTPGTYLFHARWHAQTRRTRPMYEFNFADVKGEGRYVGSSLLVSNPSSAWWGEGDEKVYVDGEKFPSLFGTGTEDYFGYAWSDPTSFARPYHAQPPTPNRGNLGQTQNVRWHVFDDIPFRTGIRFDMEAWHWADVECTYATTAFWYARPGSTLPESAPVALVPDAPLPQPVKDAIEGESLKWTVTDGATEMQSGFAALSGDRQFWWREAKVGSTATTRLDVPTAGRYEVVANLGHAVDYGRFRVTVGDGVPKEIDLYQGSLEWRRESLGTFDLPRDR